ncbi:MAG TPA: helix-turn-helix domain-containing protein [Streptosporangiaceae bacterium]|nr:helix-turn-helix domain-containing protein [Streptosporangiaceae bacterium]
MVTTADTDRHGNGKAPSRTRLPAAERRETILRAATEVFAEAGYRAGKVSDVAARVGVTEPVIFQNFGSKAALFAAVLERAAAEVRASLDDLATGFGSASGLLAHVLTPSAHGRSGQATTDPGARHEGTEHAGAAYGVLFAGATALAAEPELTEPARKAFRAIAAHLADLIQRARADGSVRPDTDPEAAAWLLLSVLSARRLRAAAMPADLEPAVTALALRALAPPAAAPRSRDQRPPDVPGSRAP